MDEMVLDGTLNTTWHIIIDSRKADGHTDRFVFGKQRTALTLHLGIVQVDTVGVKSVFGLVTGEQAVKAMLTKGADCSRCRSCLLSQRRSALWSLVSDLSSSYRLQKY